MLKSAGVFLIQMFILVMPCKSLREIILTYNHFVAFLMYHESNPFDTATISAKEAMVEISLVFNT